MTLSPLQTPRLAALAILALGLSTLSTSAQALAPFGAYVEVKSEMINLYEGGSGSFEASKTYVANNRFGDGVVGYGGADLAAAQLHSASLATLGSCPSDSTQCSIPAWITSTAAMWDTVTFYSKDGGPVENISLLPTYLDIDGVLHGDGAKAYYRTYWGHDANYDVDSLPWEELTDGTRQSLDSLLVPIGVNPLFVYFELKTTASIRGTRNAVARADFGDTMSFNWVMPDDLAFTSASGTFLSGGASAVPEPATWAMMITGFGLVGVVLRRRPASHPA